MSNQDKRESVSTAEAIEHLAAILNAHSEYDQRLCCSGNMCGCLGSTVFDAILHYFREGVSKPPIETPNETN